MQLKNSGNDYSSNTPAAILGDKQDLNIALLKASEIGDLDKVLELIKQGADVNYQQQKGDETALMLASQHNHPDVVEALIKNGADLKLKLAVSNYTALDLAISSDAQDIASMIIENLDTSFTWNASVYAALYHNNATKLGRLLNKGGILPFNFPTTDMDLLLLTRKDTKTFEFLQQNIIANLGTYIEMIQENNKVLFAIPWLSSTQDKDRQVRQMVETELKALEDTAPKIKKILDDFLNNDATLASQRFNQLGVCYEILKLLKHPELLQQNGNFCGMVTILQLLIKNAPEKFVSMALELVSQGRTGGVLQLKASKENLNNAVSLGCFMGEVMRHEFNIMGYHPNRFCEAFFGSTRPKRIVDTLENVRL